MQGILQEEKSKRKKHTNTINQLKHVKTFLGKLQRRGCSSTRGSFGRSTP